jgi:acyl carrier protein
LSTETNSTIREVLREHARLPVDVDTLGNDVDLFSAGMTSHASVNLMLALEDAFESIGAINAAIDEISSQNGHVA